MSIRRNSIRRLYSGLLVLAVLLRALIPDGFMPDMKHAGVGHMMICPGMAGSHHESGKPDKRPPPCPFTPLVTPDLPGIVAAPQAAPVYPLTPDFSIHVLASQATVKPWQSRGPPARLTSV